MRTLLAISTFLALTFSAAGAEGCVPSTSDPEIVIGDPSEQGTRYVDNDNCVNVDPSRPVSYEIGHYWVTVHGPVELDCLFSIWSYSESNGIVGLQRGDEVVDDTCGGMIEPDTLDPY